MGHQAFGNGNNRSGPFFSKENSKINNPHEKNSTKVSCKCLLIKVLRETGKLFVH